MISFWENLTCATGEKFCFTALWMFTPAWLTCMHCWWVWMRSPCASSYTGLNAAFVCFSLQLSKSLKVIFTCALWSPTSATTLSPLVPSWWCLTQRYRYVLFHCTYNGCPRRVRNDPRSPPSSNSLGQNLSSLFFHQNKWVQRNVRDCYKVHRVRTSLVIKE